MRIFNVIIIALTLCSLLETNSSYASIRPIYKIGSYFEFDMSFEITTVRFSGKVVADTVMNNIRFQTLRIFNEPAMGTYNQYYYHDTVTNILYSRGGYTNGCLDNDLKQKVIGFNWPKGYIFNTCYDTMGGSFRRSFVNDTGTFSIFNSGIPLRVIQRKDTVGSPIWGAKFTVYSEMFGFLSLYQGYGSPFGGGWYSITIDGAIIDSVTYGTILLKVEQTSTEIPDKFTMNQNYPNPFNSTTVIEFSLPKSSNVRLKILDMLGREVSLLFDERKSAGSYKYRFDAGALSSGVYLYKLETDYGLQSKRMIIIK